jgi:hypothetical protein
VLTNLQNSAAAKAGTIVLGCSAAALIPKMIGLWQEKVRTEVLLALLPNVKPEMQQTLINILWKRLSSRGGSTPK